MGNQEKILVIGGAGYIGSVNTAALVEKGYKTVVVDNLEKGHKEAVHPDAELEICDVRSLDALDAVFHQYGFDAVMHFGAYSLVGESMTQPEKYFYNNVEGGHNILRCMKKYGVKRIVFSSTAATYGNPERIPIQENDRTEPINPYGRSKLAFEFLLKSYEEAHGIRHAVLRYFNAAGGTAALGEDHQPETHLIPLILQVASGKRENIAMFGTDYATPDGTCVRDYIHVLDLADAHLRALEYAKNESITCNLGNGLGFSVRQVIDAARAVTKHPIPAIEHPRRAGDPDNLTASSKRARQVLGWKPQFADLDPIIESAWKWHQQHPYGYGK